MSGTVFVSLSVFAVFLVLWFVLSRRKDRKDTPVTYVCMECGEKNCNCYREDKIPEKRD